jgi:putative NADH-flavin reductase
VGGPPLQKKELSSYDSSFFPCNISYADYAITMVDEIEKGHHINQRISVVGA